MFNHDMAQKSAFYNIFGMIVIKKSAIWGVVE